MQNKKIVIIDTECANASSLGFAISRLGYKVQISKDPKIIASADRLFLPGVGTAKEAMHNLAKHDLVDFILALKLPTLGVCLGMQLFSRLSYENNSTTPCFNIIDTEVKLLQTKGLPLPHMGWNTLSFEPNHPLFTDISSQDYFYFVHSYCMPVASYSIAQCHYGSTFSAAVQKDNFYGVQFHPERSGQCGAKLIQNFIEM